MEPKLILEIVKDYFNVTDEDLKCTMRCKIHVMARHIIFYLCREYTDLSLAQIGKLSDRDHVTVMHGVQSVKNQIETNRGYKKEVEAIIEKIRFRYQPTPEINEKHIEIFMENDFFKPFRNPYENHSTCTNQPYSGYIPAIR